MTSKFKYRSCKPEFMDAPHIPKELLFQNLHELDVLNRTLGGHLATMAGIKSLVTEKSKVYNIIDIGCGGGDSMVAIANWARAENFKVKLTGVDINPYAINYLKEHCKDYSEIRGVVCNYKEFLKKVKSVDIICSSLFCHHLNDNELMELFRYFKFYTKVGFIINDLRRNGFAYYSVWCLTRFLNASKMAKNDGPLSVLRGFKQEELDCLLQKAQIRNYSICAKWAFRYLVVGKSENNSMSN